MRGRDDQPFRGLVPTGAPEELRDRTLRAARRAMTQPVAPDLWARIWRSRTARLAWAAAAAVLLLGHAWVGSAPSSALRPAMPILALDLSHETELAETVGLPRVSNRAAAWLHRSDQLESNDNGGAEPSITGSLS